MIKRILSTLFFVPLISHAGLQQIAGFECSEHMDSASAIQLQGLPDSNKPLNLANGLTLSYSQIMALAGDFYGILGQAISEGRTSEERQNYFINAYNSLAQNPKSVTEVPEILKVVEYEQNKIQEGKKNGIPAEEIFKSMSEQNNRQWNCITGGGCDSLWWLNQGRYLQLAKRGYDHFGDDAWLAYKAGHELALNEAIKAHFNGDIKTLEYAYTLNAYASHFLSDRFSSGHLRTPFVHLVNEVTPSTIGSVLVTFMHNEENHNGLHVHNLRGDHWIAYGDRRYFDSVNDQNTVILKEALQESANQIYSAFTTGQIPNDESVFNLIPVADETGKNRNQDITPLFYRDESNHLLLRRSNTSNLHDKEFTSNWWGWSTLIELSKERGLPTEVQEELVASNNGKEALRYGLITDKEVLKGIN